MRRFFDLYVGRILGELAVDGGRAGVALKGIYLAILSGPELAGTVGSWLDLMAELVCGEFGFVGARFVGAHCEQLVPQGCECPKSAWLKLLTSCKRSIFGVYVSGISGGHFWCHPPLELLPCMFIFSVVNDSQI